MQPQDFVKQNHTEILLSIKFQLMDLSLRHTQHLGAAMWLLSNITNSLALNYSGKHFRTYSQSASPFLSLSNLYIQMHEYKPQREEHTNIQEYFDMC